MVKRLQIDPKLIPSDVRKIFEALRPYDSYVVGGVVREIARLLLDGRDVSRSLLEGNDWDVATACRPEEAMARLRKQGFAVLPIGVEHGTVVVHRRRKGGEIDPQRRYEVTTFRYDRICDGRRAVVEFTDTLEEDLARRDFTVNALAMDTTTGMILDSLNGLRDLEDGVIRAVGNPRERFVEDSLRLLRAIRFVVAVDGRMEEQTWEAIQENAKGIRNISAERIRDELMKLLSYERPSRGLKMMHECGLLREILPELDRCFGVEQNRHHADDVGLHTLLVADAVSPKYPLLRFIALMHDLGKPGTREYSEEKQDFTFYGHEVVGGRLAAKVMKRLRFSAADIEQGKLLTQSHMYPLDPVPMKKTIRRWLHRMGEDNFRALLRLKIADRKGNRGKEDVMEPGVYCTVRLLRQINRDQDALSLKDLQIGGKDLMDLGMRPGPAFGEILNALLDRVLEDPSLNDRETLLRMAGELIESREG